MIGRLLPRPRPVAPSVSFEAWAHEYDTNPGSAREGELWQAMQLASVARRQTDLPAVLAARPLLEVPMNGTPTLPKPRSGPGLVLMMAAVLLGALVSARVAQPDTPVPVQTAEVRR